jgi:predicted nuclease with TOPRIM domain
MNRTNAWIAAAVVVLALVLGHYGERISDAYGEAFKVQLHLDETNGELESLQKRVQELEDMRTLDEQRIAELEARLFSK